MTDSAPAQLAATHGDTLARRRRLLVLAVVLALLGSSAGWFYLRISEQSRVLAAIEAAGGKYHAPDRGQYMGYALQRLFGQMDPPRGYDVLLDGPKFDDAWLAEQHRLRSLPIDELLTSDTRLSRDALMGLFNDNDLTTLNVAGAPLTDADAAIIGRQERLTHLNLQQSKISDTGLAALNPARFSALDVSGTQVTSTALQQQLTGRQLQYLGVDGKQFTPELAAQLAGMSTFNMIRLAGPDVTDAHLELLEGFPRLLYINVDQTSVTAEAVESLKAARPQLQVDVHDAETAFFKWQAE